MQKLVQSVTQTFQMFCNLKSVHGANLKCSIGDTKALVQRNTSKRRGENLTVERQKPSCFLVGAAVMKLPVDIVINEPELRRDIACVRLWITQMLDKLLNIQIAVFESSSILFKYCFV